MSLRAHSSPNCPSFSGQTYRARFDNNSSPISPRPATQLELTHGSQRHSIRGPRGRQPTMALGPLGRLKYARASRSDRSSSHQSGEGQESQNESPHGSSYPNGVSGRRPMLRVRLVVRLLELRPTGEIQKLVLPKVGGRLIMIQHKGGRGWGVMPKRFQYILQLMIVSMPAERRMREARRILRSGEDTVEVIL